MALLPGSQQSVVEQLAELKSCMPLRDDQVHCGSCLLQRLEAHRSGKLD